MHGHLANLCREIFDGFRAMIPRPFPGPATIARSMLIRRIRAVFSDHSKGERPIAPSDDALFKPDTPICMVHADVVAMMIGGMRALLLQMLHPIALQGVLDHSDFRSDVQGRLRRTARFIALTTYGNREDAIKAITTVNAIHARLNGILPDGKAYSAMDPRVLAWVHLAEATSFLDAYLAYGNRGMSEADQDWYFDQSGMVAEMLGASPIPGSRAEAVSLMREMRVELAGSAAAREVAAFLLNGGAGRRIGFAERVLWKAAVDLLPPFARTMLDLERPDLTDLPAIASAHAMARTVRWAFQGSR